jgi:hypothetical protein
VVSIQAESFTDNAICCIFSLSSAPWKLADAIALVVTSYSVPIDNFSVVGLKEFGFELELPLKDLLSQAHLIAVGSDSWLQVMF